MFLAIIAEAWFTQEPNKHRGFTMKNYQASWRRTADNVVQSYITPKYQEPVADT